jgi:hypothetical protein
MPGSAELNNRVLKFIDGKVNSIMKSADSILGDATEDAINNSSGFTRSILQSKRGYLNKEYGLGGKNGAIARAYSKDQSQDISLQNANLGAIAGSYIGASAGYRVLSGGGVTKDGSGNPNVIGIPFV